MVNAVQYAACVVLALCIAGCSGESEAPEPPTSVFGDQGLLKTGEVDVNDFGIGDAETSLKVVLSVDPDTDRTNVRYEEFLTQKKDLAKVEVHVSKPYPESLLLHLAIRSFDDFVGHAVQVLPHMFIDGVQQHTYGLIYGDSALSERYEFSFDVMEYLDEIPERILVHTETEVNLFMDTNESAITLATPRENERNTSRILSSPVVIYFE